MDHNQFGIEIAKKFQQFFAHMNKFCQQFLKDQNVPEIQTTAEKKKERDPNAPKKPLTPFFLFYQKYREKVVELNSEIKLTQISQMAGNKWQSMSEQEKKPYLDQYNAAKEKYEQELKDYNEKNGIETNDKKRKKSEKVNEYKKQQFDEKSMKLAVDHNVDDFQSESVQPAAKHQQQIKQQQQKESNNDDQVKQQPGKQTKQQQQQKQNPAQTKKSKNVEIDDDIQRDIDQAMKNPKQVQKKQKK